MTLASLSGAPRFEHLGFVFRPLAVPSRGSAELAVWTLEVVPGARSERHTVSREEVFVLQQGAAHIAVGDEVHELVPGDAVIVPPDTPIQLSNPGAAIARLTVCTSKGVLGKVGGKTIEPPWAQ